MTSRTGQTIFTGEDILSGQQAFLTYGMLAIALLVFCLRYLLSPDARSDRWIGFSFWALNLGLAWMVFANLFPIGVLQLGDAVTNGYWHARSIELFQRSRDD